MNTADLRKELKFRRIQMSRRDVLYKSNLIITRLISLESFISFKNIMAYSSFNNEVDTEELLDIIIKKSGSVILPKIIHKDIVPFYVEDRKNLEKGVYGLKEPKINVNKEILIEDINMIIVPGVVFDKNCNRIGMGKGYYDRFLSRLLEQKKVYTIGLGYEFQVKDILNVKEHDIQLDIVITENNVYTKNGG